MQFLLIFRDCDGLKSGLILQKESLLLLTAARENRGFSGQVLR